MVSVQYGRISCCSRVWWKLLFCPGWAGNPSAGKNNGGREERVFNSTTDTRVNKDVTYTEDAPDQQQITDFVTVTTRGSALWLGQNKRATIFCFSALKPTDTNPTRPNTPRSSKQALEASSRTETDRKPENPSQRQQGDRCFRWRTVIDGCKRVLNKCIRFIKLMLMQYNSVFLSIDL